MIAIESNLSPWDEIFVDNFAGGGGASTGIEQALGRPVDECLNHDREALAMHRMNHPHTRHHPEDIRTADPRAITRGRPVGGVWFSPDCKHHSKARGGKPRDKKIRGLAWSVINWVNKLAPMPPRVIYLENVEEFQTWCPLLPNGKLSKWRKNWFFLCFTGALFRRGYVEIQWAAGDGFIYRRTWAGIERVPDVTYCTRACNDGAPTIRRRLYLIAKRDGCGIVWPKATHAAPDSIEVHEHRLKRFRTMAECVDWSHPCPSIFLTKKEAKMWRCNRPLVKASLRRIAKGVDRFVLKAKRPFIVCLTHQGGDRCESLDVPASTITAAHRGERALVAPIVAYAQHGGAVRPADAPMHTIAASVKDQNQLICASVVKMRGTNIGHAINEPLHTISAAGMHHGLVAAFVAQHNTGVVGHPVDKPVSTIVGRGTQQQLVCATMFNYYGTDQAPSMHDPAPTVTTKDRFALVEAFGSPPPLTPELEAGARRVAAFLRRYGVNFEGEFAMVGDLVLTDIGMRMFKPRELYRAQGFPEGYIIERGLHIEADGAIVEIPLSGTAQIRMCGNSVSPPKACALVAANNPELRWHLKVA